MSSGEQTPLERLELLVKRFEDAATTSATPAPTWTTKRIVGVALALLAAAGGGGYGGAGLKMAQLDWRVTAVEDATRSQQEQNQRLILNANTGLADLAGLKAQTASHDRELDDLKETMRSCCMGKRSAAAVLNGHAPLLSIDLDAPPAVPPTPPWVTMLWGVP